jgi:hypothetical protein
VGLRPRKVHEKLIPRLLKLSFSKSFAFSASQFSGLSFSTLRLNVLCDRNQQPAVYTVD